MWDDERSVARFFSSTPDPKRKSAGIAEAFGPPRESKETGVAEFFNGPKRREISHIAEALTDKDSDVEKAPPSSSKDYSGKGFWKGTSMNQTGINKLCQNCFDNPHESDGPFCADCKAQGVKESINEDAETDRLLTKFRGLPPEEKIRAWKIATNASDEDVEALWRRMTKESITEDEETGCSCTDSICQEHSGLNSCSNEGTCQVDGKTLCDECAQWVTESAESFMDRKFKDCTEDTTSGGIAIVPMGFKDVCPNCKGEGCSSCGGTGRTRNGPGNSPIESVHEAAYSPKTGEKCSCKPGMERDNCPSCEGSGMKIDFSKIRRQRKPVGDEREKMPPGTPDFTGNLKTETINRIVRNLLGEAQGEKCPNCGADDWIGGVCFKCGEGEEGSEPGDVEYDPGDFKAAFRDRSNREAIRRRRQQVNEESDCSCEDVTYENEDGLCHHKACEGDRSGECGKIVDGTPTDSCPEHHKESVHCYKRRVTEDIDQSIFTRLLHYKTDIPDLIGTIEGIISTNTPADSDDLFDELAEVVNLLAKADHTLATLITSKNLRTPKAKPEDEPTADDDGREPRYDPDKKLEVRPSGGRGFPMDRPDETQA